MILLTSHDGGNIFVDIDTYEYSDATSSIVHDICGFLLTRMVYLHSTWFLGDRTSILVLQ